MYSFDFDMSCVLRCLALFRRGNIKAKSASYQNLNDYPSF
jgi:hypothetical protein